MKGFAAVRAHNRAMIAYPLAAQTTTAVLLLIMLNLNYEGGAIIFCWLVLSLVTLILVYQIIKAHREIQKEFNDFDTKLERNDW